MRLFLDEWGGGTETFELSADLARTLIARRFVMISLPIYPDASIRVSHTSDASLTSATGGILLREVIGPAAAESLLQWGRSETCPDDVDLIGVGARPGTDDERVITAHRVKVFLQIETAPEGRVLHITFRDIHARCEAREELGFVALRQDLEAARASNAVLANRLHTLAAQAGGGHWIGEDARHGLRNHLNGILPVCELLASRSLTAGDQAMVELMKQSARAIRTLLDGPANSPAAANEAVAKTETPDATSSFSLKAVVQAVEQISTAAATARGITFVREGASLNFLRVGGDGLLLRQALSQVVGEVIATSNARRVVLDVARVEAEMSGRLLYRFTVSEMSVGPRRSLRMMPSDVSTREREARLTGPLAIVAAMGGRLRVSPGDERRIVIELPFVAITLSGLGPDAAPAKKFPWRLN